MPIALITGASRGLGRATAQALSNRGWSLVVDARREAELADAIRGLRGVVAIGGDVSSPGHRAALATAINDFAELALVEKPTLGALRQAYETNVVAPLALIQLLAEPLAAAGGAIINLSSDAAVEAYEGWGGYGSSKAALDQITNVLAAEEAGLRCYAFDPGDMRTGMHQQAFPGEDISDRPEPDSVVPALLRLIDERPPRPPRYRAADLTFPSPAEVTS